MDHWHWRNRKSQHNGQKCLVNSLPCSSPTNSIQHHVPLHPETWKGTAELFFEDLRVPSSALLDKENHGFHNLTSNCPRGALPLVGGLLPRMPLSTLAEVPLKPHVHISRTGLSFHSMCQTKGGCAMEGISRAEAMFELTCDWVPQRNLGLWKAPGWPAETRSNVLN